MSHTISVEIDDEVARQFVEACHHHGYGYVTPAVLEELSDACVRALDEDDA